MEMKNMTTTNEKTNNDNRQNIAYPDDHMATDETGQWIVPAGYFPSSLGKALNGKLGNWMKNQTKNHQVY